MKKQKKIIVDDLKKLDLDLPFKLDEVDDRCKTCIVNQVNKYREHVYNNKLVGEKFLVVCEGIKKQKIPSQLRKQFSAAEISQIEIMSDPVRFAKAFFIDREKNPWTARDPHQNLFLKCTSLRKVLRISRRAGKTDAMIVDIGFQAIRKKKQILIAGPNITHVKEMFERIKALIEDSKGLSGFVIKTRANPYLEMILQNGSVIRGFAAGSDGRTTTALRGQDADRIYLDEADYIDQRSISNVIIPILQTREGTALIASSTPSGLKTIYQDFCLRNPYYKEFYYDYTVLPWADKIEMERGEMSQSDWDREYLALFATPDEGVYKKTYIKEALRAYEYQDSKREANWYYTMGVDWNEQKGAEIVVLGFDKFNKEFKVVDAHHVEKSEYTQLHSIKQVLEMNRKWKPNFIYADAGNGSTNIELMRKKSQIARQRGGEDQDLAKLLDILKPYDAGSKIEVEEPVTHEKVRKQAKAFMVNASIRTFEKKRITISSTDKKLREQMENYIILGYSPTKVPKYGTKSDKIGDHRLDALNLAIVAFHLEFDSLYESKPITDVAVTQDGRKKSESHRLNYTRKEDSSTRTTRSIVNSIKNDNIDKGEFGCPVVEHWGEPVEPSGVSSRHYKSRRSRRIGVNLRRR